MRTPTIINNIKVKVCALLGYYTVYNGNFLPTFRDNPSVSSSRVKVSKKVVPKRRQGITTIHCLITQKSAYLIGFAAEY